MIHLMKLYFVFTVLLILVYSIRHVIFTLSRFYRVQKLYYQDIVMSDLPFITILIPMHNEEKVVHGILDALLECDYPKTDNGDPAFEIIPINDFSEDKTREIVDAYAKKYPFIKPLHRYEGHRGKPAALNAALKNADGNYIIVFDADYIPGKGLLRELAAAFLDPSVGAVMGRVIPINTEKNILTRLIDMERSGGYQVDQQARYNLNLLPQYGGTVGGFRKDLLLRDGGFDEDVLAEDTELTYRMTCDGWKIAYANAAECYEETPENWRIRGRQIRRWARGHNGVMFRYLGKIIATKYLNFYQKVDAFLLLIIYLVPVLLLLGMIDSVALFFLGEMNIFSGWWVLLFVGAYNTFGNFAPFFEIGTANILDSSKERILLLPFLSMNFYYYLLIITEGFLDALLDIVTGRQTTWRKTDRFRKEARKE